MGRNTSKPVFIRPKRVWIAPTGNLQAPAFLSVGHNVYRYLNKLLFLPSIYPNLS